MLELYFRSLVRTADYSVRLGNVNNGVDDAASPHIWSKAIICMLSLYRLRIDTRALQTEPEVDSISHSKRFGTFVDVIRFGFLVLKFSLIAITEIKNL